MKVEKKGNELHIIIPMNPAPFPLSSTGKTLSVASSGGNQATTIQVDGKVLKVGVNAFIGADK